MRNHPTPANDEPICFVGIDPGASGGMACLYPILQEIGPGLHNDVVVKVSRIDTISANNSTHRELWRWIESHKHATRFVMEQVGGFIKESRDGEVGGGQPGSRAFTFGKNTGRLEGFMIAADIECNVVHPATWQRTIGVVPRKRGEAKTQWKTRLKRLAQYMFPTTKVTKAIADALLIAYYCYLTSGLFKE